MEPVQCIFRKAKTAFSSFRIKYFSNKYYYSQMFAGSSHITIACNMVGAMVM